MKETIGWIGLGQMGHRMSRHLATAGHALVVADAATTERAPPGVRVAKSNAGVAAEADTVILSLPDGNVSQAVAREIAAASPRKARMVIDTSTIGIKAAEAVAAILAEADIAFVDAPVSGGTAGAEKATLAIMLACPAETYERLKPLDEPDGQAVLRRAEAGAGTGGEAAQQLPLRHRAGGHQRGHRLRREPGHRDEDHPRHRQRLDRAQFGDRRQVPPPHHARALRRRLHRQAATQGHQALSGERARRRHQRRDRRHGGERLDRDGAGLPGADICEMYPYTRDGRRKN